VYTEPIVRNFCGECNDILVDPIEFRWGYCLWCLTIMLEKMDARIADMYYDDDEGDAI
jgi:hypothetical protein